MNKFHHGDLVYLTRDTSYNNGLFKKGQEFIVVRQNEGVVECEFDGSGNTFNFSHNFLTSNPSDILWSNAFFQVLLDVIGVTFVYIIVFAIILHIILSC